MGDLVNLRRERKRRARAAGEEAAAENRIRHGRTRTERALASRRERLDAERHAGHRLTIDNPTDDQGVS